MDRQETSLTPPQLRLEMLPPNDDVIDGGKDDDYAEHKHGIVHCPSRHIGGWRKPEDSLMYAISAGRSHTHGDSTTIGLIVHRAVMLTNHPHRPREKRSRGSPPPFHLCQTQQEMVMT